MKREAASARTNSRIRLIALAVPVIFLAAFHAALLVRRIADASITRPLVLERWAFAAVLLAAGFVARRFFTGRRVAIIFWLLVAVLHLVIPSGGSVNNNAALLLTVLPALIVAGANAGSPSTPSSASRLLRIDPIAFASFSLVPLHDGRAPPLF